VEATPKPRGRIARLFDELDCLTLPLILLILATLLAAHADTLRAMVGVGK
jgi:hypothetical protein